MHLTGVAIWKGKNGNVMPKRVREVHGVLSRQSLHETRAWRHTGSVARHDPGYYTILICMRCYRLERLNSFSDIHRYPFVQHKFWGAVLFVGLGTLKPPLKHTPHLADHMSVAARAKDVQSALPLREMSFIRESGRCLAMISKHPDL